MRNFIKTVVVSSILLTLIVAVALSVQAQKYTVLHSFTGGIDGSIPFAGLSMDAAGNLYGTTFSGGVCCGTVFKMERKDAEWIFAPLYSFLGGNDGEEPFSGVTIGPDGVCTARPLLEGEMVVAMGLDAAQSLS
jgi:hypothetical protein